MNKIMEMEVRRWTCWLGRGMGRWHRVMIELWDPTDLWDIDSELAGWLTWTRRRMHMPGE